MNQDDINAQCEYEMDMERLQFERENMSNRFSYVRYDDEATEKQAEFRRMFEEIEAFAESNLKHSRPKSLLLTALEEAYMWTGKAIRDDQIERTGQVDEQPERGNE